MNGLLRSLHPDRDSEPYFVNWYGGKWRMYDFTPAPTGLPDYSWMNPPETVNRSTAQYERRPQIASPMETLAAALTEVPRTIGELSQLTGVTYCKSRQWLRCLAKAGRATVVKDQIAVPVLSYRRVRAQAIYRYAKPGWGDARKVKA